MTALPVTDTIWTPASMGDPACAEGCPPPTARPYARKKIPSVTTLIGVMDKPGLSWGAAKETATYAVHHQADWRGLDPDEAIERLYKHHRGVWDRSALVGTLVHSCAEAWSYGQSWDIPDDTDPDVVRRLPGYINGLAAFFEDNQPQVIATEVCVRGRTSGGDVTYAGTADWIAQIDGDVWLLDIKTTSNLDESKEFYTKEWRLQLAAYRWAEEVVHYHGTTEVAAWPLADCFPRPTRTGILHMRGNDGYQLIEVDSSVALLVTLDACAAIREWGLTGGHATPAPVIAAERRKEPITPRPSAPVDKEAMLG